MDVDDSAGKVDQDWCEVYSTLEQRHVPTGRGRGNAGLVRSDPRPHRALGNPAAPGGLRACVASTNSEEDSTNCRRVGPRAATHGFQFPQQRGLGHWKRRKLPVSAEKPAQALDARGGRKVRIVTTMSLDRVEVHRKWEMSAKTAFIGQPDSPAKNAPWLLIFLIRINPSFFPPEVSGLPLLPPALLRIPAKSVRQSARSSRIGYGGQ